MIFRAPLLSPLIITVSAPSRLLVPGMSRKTVSPGTRRSVGTEWPAGVIILLRLSILTGSFGWRRSTRRTLRARPSRTGALTLPGFSHSLAKYWMYFGLHQRH